MLTTAGKKYQLEEYNSSVPKFIRDLPDNSRKEELKDRYDKFYIGIFPCKWIFDKVSESRPSIRYFDNFNLVKSINSLCIIFECNQGAADNVLDVCFNTFRTFSADKINMLFKDLGVEPHYNVDKTATLRLFLQIVNHLGSTEYYIHAILTEIQTRIFNAGSNHLDLHTGLIVSPKRALYRKYREYNMCTDNPGVITILKELIFNIDTDLVQIICKTIFEAQQNKHYICLDTKEEVSGVKLNTYSFKTEQLRICSNYESRFNMYTKHLLEYLEDENYYSYKLGHTLNKVKENISSKYGYFNLDTGRPNKTSSNKEFCCEEYLLLSDDKKKLDWYSKACKRHHLIAVEIRRSERLAEKAEVGIQWVMIEKPKPKRSNIAQPVREQVWREQFKDKIDGECWCCNKPISFTSFYAGHIVSDNKGGLSIASNLLPVCRSCNLSMGTANLYDFVIANDLPGKLKIKNK